MEIFSRDGPTPGETYCYSVAALREIARDIDEVVKVPVSSDFLWNASWKDALGNPVSPRHVLRNIENPLYVEHRLAIADASLDYPVLVNEDMTDCYDGLHRIAKAITMNLSHVDGKVITDAQKEASLVERIRPKIVHISGSYETTFVEQLENPRIAVYDTTEFFRNIMESGYGDATDDAKEIIRDTHFGEGFETAMWNSQHKSVVVFIGFLDHASPNGRNYDKQHFDVRVFLDVPVSQIIKQYYKCVAYALDDDKILGSIVPPNNTREIPDSNSVYRWHVEIRESHIQRGYELLTPGEIVRRVAELGK